MNEANIRKILEDTQDPIPFMGEGIVRDPITIPNFINDHLTAVEMTNLNNDNHLTAAERVLLNNDERIRRRIQHLKNNVENTKPAVVQNAAKMERNKIFSRATSGNRIAGIEMVGVFAFGTTAKHPISNQRLRDFDFRQPNRNLINGIDQSLIRDFRPHLIMLILAVRQAILNAPAHAPLNLTFAERETIATFLRDCTQAELDQARVNLAEFNLNPNGPILNLDNEGVAAHEYCEIFQAYNAHHLPAPAAIVAGQDAFDLGPDTAPGQQMIDTANKADQEMNQWNQQIQAIRGNPEFNTCQEVLGNQAALNAKINQMAQHQNTIQQERLTVQARVVDAVNRSERARGAEAKTFLDQATAANDRLVKARNEAHVLFQGLMKELRSTLEARPDHQLRCARQGLDAIKGQVTRLSQFQKMSADIVGVFHGKAIAVNEAIATSKNHQFVNAGVVKANQSITPSQGAIQRAIGAHTAYVAHRAAIAQGQAPNNQVLRDRAREVFRENLVVKAELAKVEKNAAEVQKLYKQSEALWKTGTAKLANAAAGAGAGAGVKL